ncbi:MAG: hypothetical protein ACJAZP_003807 [Psychromonas sp.]|jgi:hypothetical protein|uniref:hypothetical protein n=1 Tax=Psychromonas sp. TaxID=1884585 RepID=UPI0039E26043
MNIINKNTQKDSLVFDKEKALNKCNVSKADKSNLNKKPCVSDCQLIPRKQGDILFHFESLDVILPYLDGYTILPNEVYEKLIN